VVGLELPQRGPQELLVLILFSAQLPLTAVAVAVMLKLPRMVVAVVQAVEQAGPELPVLEIHQVRHHRKVIMVVAAQMQPQIMALVVVAEHLLLVQMGLELQAVMVVRVRHLQ
jgi:hypothetical protein